MAEKKTDAFNAGRVLIVERTEYVVREIAWSDFKQLMSRLQARARALQEAGVTLDALSVDTLLERLPVIVDVAGAAVEDFVEMAADPKAKSGWSRDLGFGAFMTLATAAFEENREGLEVFFRVLRSGADALMRLSDGRRATSAGSSMTSSRSPAQGSPTATSGG